MKNGYLIFICLLVTAFAFSQASRNNLASWFRNENFFETNSDLDQDYEASDRQDQEEAPTNEHHVGRVQIKVYRGPDTHDEHEHFAPYGFWVKQPADNQHR